MSTRERSARRLIRWYPRAWRASHEEEFLALLEDSLADRPFWPGRTLNIAFSGLCLRASELHRSPRRVLFTSSAPLVGLLLVVGVATNGFGLLSARVPTKGPMPYDPPKGPAYKRIPDYLSVYIGPHRVGYTPKAYLAAPNGAGNAPLLGSVAPVYASNLTTLLGHEYPGIGFVPLGESPWSEPCRVASVINRNADGTVTTSTIPCPSTTFVLPNLVGDVTPTGVGRLSGLGVNVIIQNAHSRVVRPGHIISTSPKGGSMVHARQQVIVRISVSP